MKIQVCVYMLYIPIYIGKAGEAIIPEALYIVMLLPEDCCGAFSYVTLGQCFSADVFLNIERHCDLLLFPR